MRFQILFAILLVACNTAPTGQTANAPQPTQAGNAFNVRSVFVEPMPTPTNFLGRFKTYSFETMSDFGFNQLWFFQVKSGGAKANPSDLQGKLCFQARETKSVIREWGHLINGEWVAFEFAPWKKVGDVWGLGVCLSASRLREAAEWGGMKTAEMVGLGSQARVAPVPTHQPISGVEQKYWTNIWSCNCAWERDLRITNPYDFPVCVHWRMKNEQMIMWVSKS